jgi:hypothetical protein
MSRLLVLLALGVAIAIRRVLLIALGTALLLGLLFSVIITIGVVGVAGVLRGAKRT